MVISRKIPTSKQPKNIEYLPLLRKMKAGKFGWPEWQCCQFY